jgi:beta-D-galactosyl-(1->4)-L-rhamnose phosphorylase
LTLNKVKISSSPQDKNHFILEDLNGEIDFGKDIDNIFVIDKKTVVLSQQDGSIKIAANRFSKGHSIYMSGFKFTPENTRLLHRGLFWAAGRENEYGSWTSSNIRTDCAYYPDTKKLVVISSSDKAEKTKVTGEDGKVYEVSLEPHGIKIIDL